MAGEQQRPAPQPTTTEPKPRRVDAGDRQFTAPVAENDREGPLSNAAFLEDLYNQYIPYGGGFDYGMGYGGYDPYGFGFGGMYGYPSPMLGPTDPFLGAEDEKWGEVNQTTLEDLQGSEMLKKYGDDAVLVIANGPEDMKQLNHDDEAAQIASARGTEQETVVLWNPSAEAMSSMLREGQFKDVVFSGHGEEGVVYMTGADGEAVAVDGPELAEMFKDTSVQNVFLNVCHGLGGEGSVAESLSEVGINAMGWMGKVGDGLARDGAAAWANRTRDGSGFEDMLNTARDFAGMGTREGAPQFDLSNLDLSGLDFSGMFGGFGLGGSSPAAPAAAPATPARTDGPVDEPMVDLGLDDIDLSGLSDIDLFNWGGYGWI